MPRAARHWPSFARPVPSRKSSGAAAAALRRELDRFLEGIEKRPAGSRGNVEQTVGVMRVLQRIPVRGVEVAHTFVVMAAHPLAIGAQVSAPGVIDHTNGGRIIFGASNGNGGERCNAVKPTLSDAAIACELSPEIHRVQWTKLLWNAPFCAISGPPESPWHAPP